MALADTVVFRRKDMPYLSFAAFEDMRQRRELCDLTVKVQNNAFWTHRVILAAGIPYFRSLFASNGFKTEENEVRLVNVDSDAMECLIRYTYTSRINLSKENVRSLLLASTYLNMTEVKEVCVEFLSERLHSGNVIEVRELALSCNCFKLAENCIACIKQNFEEFCKSRSFLNLPYPCLQEIIPKDDLKASSEKVVFEAVMNWVKSEPLERETVLYQLLSDVRLANLPFSYLFKRVFQEELIKRSASCMTLLRNAKNYNLLPTGKASLLNLKTRHRTNYVKNTMYAICQSRQECLVYDNRFESKTWNHLKSEPVESNRVYGVAAVDDNIYIFLQKSIEKFRPRKLEWESLPMKLNNIEGATILAHGTVIYCFGVVKSIFESAVYSFDTVKSEWLGEKKMTPRHSSAAVSMGDFVYVTGGFRNFSGQTKTAEKYNVITDSWCEIAQMVAPRASHNCAVINDKIYVCGGTSGLDYTTTAEMYDSVTNQWKNIASMGIRRSRFSLIPYDNKLYALGGCNETAKDYLEAEIYAPAEDRWMTTLFCVPQGFQSAVLVFIPHN